MRAVIVDDRGYDWEGDEPLRRPMSETIVYELQRPRLHGLAELRRRAPGHVLGRDREDPLPEGARRHRRRAAAGVRVRRARGARDQPGRRLGAAELLGLRPVPPLRAAGELLREPRPGLADHRVPRHGQGAAPGRHRGDPRRRLQPHRRGQPHGPDDQLQGPREQRLLHAPPDASPSTT